MKVNCINVLPAAFLYNQKSHRVSKFVNRSQEYSNYSKPLKNQSEVNNEKWQLGTNFTFFVSLHVVAGWYQECTAGHWLLLWKIIHLLPTEFPGRIEGAHMCVLVKLYIYHTVSHILKEVVFLRLRIFLCLFNPKSFFKGDRQ